MDPKKKRKKKETQSLRFMDDDFFTLALDEQCECAEQILRPILKDPKLKVESVRTQNVLPDLTHRGVRLDITAKSADGKIFDIEIQTGYHPVEPQRPRLYLSQLDVNLINKGETFDRLPDTFVIFITEHDMLKGDKPLYHIRRHIKELNKVWEDGTEIIFVNGDWKSEDEIGRLVHDLKASDPDQMHNSILADRMRYLKDTKEGARQMGALRESIEADLLERLQPEMDRLRQEREQAQQEREQTEQKLEQAEQEREQTEQKLEQAEQTIIELKALLRKRNGEPD